MTALISSISVRMLFSAMQFLLAYRHNVYFMSALPEIDRPGNLTAIVQCLKDYVAQFHFVKIIPNSFLCSVIQ